jgi:esterase
LRQHLGEVSGNPTSYNGNRIQARTLAIYGGNSNYVTEEGKIAFIAKCTDLTMHCLPGTGHWLHAEDPEGFYEVVSAFLL